MESAASEGEVWDAHWKSLKGKKQPLGAFLEFFRKNIIAPAVAYYIDRYFPDKGVFVEAGSGTAQASFMINKRNRRIIALDISKEALEEAKKVSVVDEAKLGDIRKMPFEKESIDGIWNLGVMEHFEEDDCISILNGFYAILKSNGRVILFWPPDYGLYRFAVVPFEFTMQNIFMKKNFSVFPDELCRIRSKAHLLSMLKRTRFSRYEIHFNAHDLFTHYVIILYK